MLLKAIVFIFNNLFIGIIVVENVFFSFNLIEFNLVEY